MPSAAHLRSTPALSLQRLVWVGIAVALAYFVAVLLGFTVIYISAHVSLIWMPTGIAVAALLRYGRGMSAAIFVAAVGVNLLSLPLGISLQIGVGNVLAPLVCAELLKIMGFRHDFGRRRDVIGFTLAAIASMSISAINGASTLWMHGFTASFRSVMLGWWAGDAVGVLLAGPLLLTWSRASLQKLRARGNEVLMFALLFGLVNWLIFFSLYRFPLTYMSVGVLIWAALRFGITGSAVAVLASSIFAAWATTHGLGPFGSGGSANLLALWGYVTIMVLITLMVTALQAESVKATEDAREAYDRITKVASRLPGAIMQYRVHPVHGVSVPYASAALEAMFEVSLEEVQRDYRKLLERTDRQDIDLGKLAFAKSAPGLSVWQNEFRITRLDGTVRWLYINTVPEPEAMAARFGIALSAILQSVNRPRKICISPRIRLNRRKVFLLRMRVGVSCASTMRSRVSLVIRLRI